jgi:hypothetical protein
MEEAASGCGARARTAGGRPRTLAPPPPPPPKGTGVVADGVDASGAHLAATTP